MCGLSYLICTSKKLSERLRHAAPYSQSPSYPVQQRLFAHPTAGPCYNLTATNHQHRWNALNLVACSQAGIQIGIDLNHRCLAGQFSCHFPHHRCEVLAVRSPGCPEFGDHRAVKSVQEIAKGSVPLHHWFKIENRQATVTFATAALLSGHLCRYQVRSAASRAFYPV